MQRWLAKTLAGAILFILPLICNIIPIKMSAYFESKGATGKVLISRLMCFGGGVFFATFLLHMMPEVGKLLDESLLEPNHIKYHVTELLIGIGFFIVLFIETLTNKAQLRFKRTTIVSQDTFVTQHGSQTKTVYASLQSNIDDIEVSTEYKSVGNGSEKLGLNGKDLSIPSPSADMTHDEGHHSRALVLALALSLHRIFEGMSIGLKQSLLSVWSMFIAVICHETVIAFSLGLQFMSNKSTVRRNVIYATICSAILPLGVAIGTILVECGETGNSLNIVNGVLQGISTGTFIYVTFFEILHDEFDHESHEFSKFFSLAVGFALMAAINAIPENREDIVLHLNSTVIPSTEQIV